MNGEQLQAGNTGSGYRNRPRPRVSAIALALSMALAGIGGVTMSQPAMAQAAPAPSQQQFSIPAGNLREALDALASQSGITVMYSPDLVAGKTTRGLSGRYTSIEALRRLLKDSGLEAQDAGDSTFTLRQAVESASNPTGARQTGKRSTREPAQSTEPDTQDLEKITVTGTRIRGSATASQVVTIGSEEIREEGFSDLGDVIRSLPQNSAGGQNPGVINGSNANIANQNSTGASGLNLRGLGPDATLTLLNGRRMGYGGFTQSVDISAIPVEAVDRIEIVADGASAIYGSDAVAGVGNVILKRDYEGVTVGARYGAADDGGLTTREYTATAGTLWSTGGVIATYKNSLVDPIFADQRSYTSSLYDPATIYPGSALKSILVSGYQSLGKIAEIRLDAFRTTRDRRSYTGYPTYTVYYGEGTTSTNEFVSPSLDISLPGAWSAVVSASLGKDEAVSDSYIQYRATGEIIPESNSCYCNESRAYEIGLEGPLFMLGGGDARLAVGAGYRTNDFQSVNLRTHSVSTGGKESSRFAYAEMNLPFIGPESGRRSVNRLAATLAVRGEDYSSFGKVTTPKIGIIYGPNESVTFKASWGKSFKAPTLLQQHSSFDAYNSPIAWFSNAESYPADSSVLMTWGGSTDLDPERANTWSTSLALHPASLPGFEAEATWFHIDYTGRVVQPVPNYTFALSDPTFSNYFTYSPTAEQLSEVINETDSFYDLTGSGYIPGNVVAILRNHYVNASRQSVRGLDITSSWRIILGDNSNLTLRGGISWLDSSQQTTSDQPVFDLAGTAYNPAKVNSRLGMVWAGSDLTASVFANYIGGVSNLLADGQEEKTSSFTTFDASVRYATRPGTGAWSGIELQLTAQNLLDRNPPLFTPPAPYIAPYDTTNYSAIGRFLSVSISKSW